MTLNELLADVYDDLGYQSAPASAVTARITRSLNEGLRVILGHPSLMRLADLDGPIPIASVASQARYVIPEALARVHAITERTNDRALSAMSLSEYRRMEPDPAGMTGVPARYVPIGRVAVAKQPSNASEIFVDSTSASDTATAYLTVLQTGGYRRTLSVTMTGVTAVSFSAAVADVIQIEDFYLSADAVGTVTLHEDASGGTELARITIGQKRPRYYGFYLWPTPSGVVDYLVDGRRELTNLVFATDEPPLPTDFHYLLAAYARMRHWERQDDTRFSVAKTHYQDGLKQLIYATQTGPDELPVMGRGRMTGHSRLGAYYPADYWTRG
jgi:hypothetical protein